MVLSRLGSWARRSPTDADETTLDEVMILAAPRSGTNYFCETLGAFPEIAGYYELFNPNGVFGVGSRVLPELCLRLGLDDVEDAKDRRLTRVFREQPFEALTALADVSRAPDIAAISYKIFPRQLPLGTLGRLMDEQHRHVVFLTRRRLDVYVSYTKAQLTQSWTNRSTAEVLPTIDADAFLSWAESTDEWYADCFALAKERQKKMSVARYETDIDIPRAELLANSSLALAHHGISVTVPEGSTGRRFKRQDSRVRPFKKIANGQQLRQELKDRRRLRYALGSPLGSRAEAHPFSRD